MGCLSPSRYGNAACRPTCLSRPRSDRDWRGDRAGGQRHPEYARLGLAGELATASTIPTELTDRTSEGVLEFANGRTHRADLVVGADGVRSTVRRWVTAADDAFTPVSAPSAARS